MESSHRQRAAAPGGSSASQVAGPWSVPKLGVRIGEASHPGPSAPAAGAAPQVSNQGPVELGADDEDEAEEEGPRVPELEHVELAELDHRVLERSGQFPADAANGTYAFDLVDRGVVAPFKKMAKTQAKPP